MPPIKYTFNKFILPKVTFHQVQYTYMTRYMHIYCMTKTISYKVRIIKYLSENKTKKKLPITKSRTTLQNILLFHISTTEQSKKKKNKIIYVSLPYKCVYTHGSQRVRRFSKPIYIYEKCPLPTTIHASSFRIRCMLFAHFALRYMQIRIDPIPFSM